MAKKTKKEKILAAYRKKLQLLEQKNISHSDKQPSIKEEARLVVVNTLPRNDTVPKHFFYDLRKSLILITVIIALEIGLYFVRLIK